VKSTFMQGRRPHPFMIIERVLVLRMAFA